MKRNQDSMMDAIRGAAISKPLAKKVAPAAKAETKPKRGRPINMYLHEEDQRKIRSLVGYLSNQDLRVSDSQAVKAALQMAKESESLVTAFLAVRDRDQRYKSKD